MNLAGSAPKFPVAWGASAGLAYINAIPVLSQIGINPGYASLTDGLPPLNATPIEAGGIPPRIQDWNGILNQLSLQSQWDQAGGPAVYDNAFAVAIGGYPKGAVLMSQATLGRWWVNKVDGNVTDPDGGGALNWQDFFAIAFNNITITGAANQLQAGSTFTNNGAFNLGNNAVYVTRAPGDNTTNLANTAFVTGAVNAAISYLETFVAANYVSDAYLAGLGLATELWVTTNFLTITDAAATYALLASFTNGNTITNGAKIEGLEIRWGQFQTVAVPDTRAFSSDFPNACLLVVASVQSGGVGDFIVMTQGWTAHDVTVITRVNGVNASGITINYIAIGF